MMTKRRKILLWAGLCLSLPAAAYSALSFIFYAWLEASRQWPTEKAAVWAFGAMALAVVFIGIFIYCLVALIKEANRTYREERNAT
jgi:hypothetical protein